MTQYKTHPLSRRHFSQVICRTPAQQCAMTNVWALTWRPGDKTSSFLGKALRPLGSPMAVVQRSEIITRPGKPSRERIHLAGYKTQVDPQTAVVHHGSEAGNSFYYDFGLRPHPGAKRQIVDVARNPSLVTLALEMDKLRQRISTRHWQLSTVPRLGTIYFGYAADALPDWEDTPALRQRVASHMRKHVGAIDGMNSIDRNMLLQAEWHDCFIPPGTGINTSSLWLISQQLCSDVRGSLRNFEYLGDLLGAELHNPVRTLQDPSERMRFNNPAQEIAAEMDITEESITADYDAYDSDFADRAVKQMRVALRRTIGRNEELFSDEDLCDGLVNPEQQLVPSGVGKPLETLGEAGTLSLMRGHAGRHADCCRDEDLLHAAAHPNQPLYAAGLMSVQLLDVGTYQFTPEELKQDRVHADFATVKPYWDPSRRPTKRHDAGGVVGSV